MIHYVIMLIYKEHKNLKPLMSIFRPKPLLNNLGLIKIIIFITHKSLNIILARIYLHIILFVNKNSS